MHYTHWLMILILYLFFLPVAFYVGWVLQGLLIVATSVIVFLLRFACRHLLVLLVLVLLEWLVVQLLLACFK
ncbi:SPX domain-containing membrane protein-like [Iris pallida]|uniref:SPX domain-containing membrane protein-like n=1 Tax=Iris pallida TaxID=29817 RepID=A0AAX6DFN3_IRIPA|nr:SPX domain-containing membrane protein-like [Iris pallida]